MPEWNSEFRGGNRLSSKGGNDILLRWAPQRLPQVHSLPSLLNSRVVPSPGAKAQATERGDANGADGCPTNPRITSHGSRFIS
jgi:hypothetical protein